MNFTLTISEENLNTIITALRIEQKRAIEEDNAEAKAHIKSALDAINNNTYIANVNDVKKRRK